MNRSVLGGALVLGALSFGFAAPSHAQEQGRQRRQRPGLAEQLKDPVGLTDDQVAKVKALDEKFRADMQKLRSDSGGDWQAMREKTKPLVDKERADVRALLTADQQAKFDAWAKQQDERRAARMRGDGGGADQKPIDSHPDKTIALGTGGFDYLKADAASRKLYVSHSTKVDVIDMDKDEKVGEVVGVEGSHGIAIAAAAKHGFATAGRKQKLIAFDPETYKTIKEIDTGEGPDAVIYAASTDEAWAMCHRGGVITCVNAKSLDVNATIDVGGTLEFAAELGGKVFVNIEDQSKIAVIDAKKHSVIGRYDVGPGEEPAGLAADAKTGLLFAGCGNRKLVVLEAATGKVVASFDIGSHCDAVAFDATTGKVYASCADGATHVFHVKDAKTIEKLAPIPTARGGKCCAIDETTHKLYVAVAPRRGQKGDSKVLVFKTESGHTGEPD